MNYSRINNIIGWLIFAISAFTYISTMEPTSSYWDCGEFISTARNGGVPHPPGAPVFMIIGRLFSLMAGNDLSQVAYWINMVSALSSAFTVLFLFWSITLLGKKIIKPENNGEFSFGQIIAIMGAGIIGSLAYNFSDSAWFSAVEAEVYAMSSFFTAFVFWAILKWEAHSEEEGADRWLLLIIFMMGLSIGVHLLNLVTIPAMGMVYYFKRYSGKITPTGIIVALMISAGMIVVIMSGIITGLPSIAEWFEIRFVNKMNLPFGSGVAFFCVLLIGALSYGIWYTAKTKKALLNFILLGFTFILIGFYSYGVIIIRSQYQPTIDMNDPENVVSFTSYLKREQYGDRPLLRGPLYTSQPTSIEYTNTIYAKLPDSSKYEAVGRKFEYKYDSRDKVLFPRMYSQEPHHVKAYEQWMGIPSGTRPTLGQNLSFLFSYQIGHMYLRYFAWNFIGRAGDEQDSGTLLPWQTKSELPGFLAKNKARNNFYMLPLIAGIAGLMFQFSRSTKDFSIVAMFFFFTGLAIILYLNQPPVEPRERDYTFAASYYAFSIWIGFAVLYLFEALAKVLKNSTARAATATAVCLVVPYIMMAEGWDDHDRSQRYFQIESAKNLLNSCDSNAILFTGGDNDTYPLWYVQEVEKIRTDVRVCNLSLLNTDWYIEQMKRQSYGSAPLPISLTLPNYVGNRNNYARYQANANVTKLSLPKFINAVRLAAPSVSHKDQYGDVESYYPSKNFVLPVDTAAVLNSGIIPDSLRKYVGKNMEWTFPRDGFDKRMLIILDIIVTNNWKRPIYFSSTVDNDDYMGLKPFMQTEGLAFRVLPVTIPDQVTRAKKNITLPAMVVIERDYKGTETIEGWINTDKMYDKMMKFSYKNLNDSTIFYDENYYRFTYNCRAHYHILAAQLLREGQKDKAKKVIDFCFEQMPDHTIAYDQGTVDFIPLLFSIGEEKRAMELAKFMATRANDVLAYLYSPKSTGSTYREKTTQLYILGKIKSTMQMMGKNNEAALYGGWYNKWYAEFNRD